MARQRWGTRFEFLLTAVGFSVGVGDLWRFPYLVMNNGGGAFLIPVLIFNILGAMPIVYLEMIMGQYSQSGALSVWRVCPMLKGVGYGTIITRFFFSIYYGVIISWMIYYFFNSFYAVLPWSTCNNAWNVKDTCVETSAELASRLMSNVTSVANASSAMYTNITLPTATVVSNATVSLMTNETLVESSKELLTSSEQFWKYKVLSLSSGLHELGSLQWELVGCVALMEVMCFFCIFRGVKLTGKIVYFTVFGPFVLLVVFLIRGALLPGADIGIKYYLYPDFEKLKSMDIWAEACMTVFVSVGPGSGAMITFASYNKFSNNCMRDAICVCLADLLTGFLGGFVIFSVLGHMCYMTGIPIERFDQSGLGLGFIVYPEAAKYLPPTQLWCALFFFMAVFLGLDSKFPQHEIVVTALRDEYPKRFKNISWTTLIVVVSCFLCALPHVTEGGMYLLTLVDWFAAPFSLTIFSLIEVIVMVYVYGVSNIDVNVKEMTGQGVSRYFKFCWMVVTPVLLSVTLACTIYSYRPPTYSGYTFPNWAIIMGWLMACTSLVPIPAFLIYKVWTTKTQNNGIMEKIRVNSKPTDSWYHTRQNNFSPITEELALDGEALKPLNGNMNGQI